MELGMLLLMRSDALYTLTTGDEASFNSNAEKFTQHSVCSSYFTLFGSFPDTQAQLQD